MHKLIMAHRYMTGASLLALAGAVHDDGEGLGLIELDQNLADVEKPLELPPGLYTGEIQDVQISQSQKGNQYFAIKFVIPNTEIPADVAEQFEDGATLFYNRIIVPNGKDRRALFNLKKFIEAIGIETNSTTIDPNEWMGRQARLKVVSEKFQGEDRAQIKSLESAEGTSRAAAKPAPAAKGRGGRK